MIIKHLLAVFTIIIFTAISCTPASKTMYAYGLQPDIIEKIDQANYGDLQKIQVGDVVQVKVSVIDPKQSEPFNLPQTAGGGSGATGGRGSGYAVDKEGMIELPNVGFVKIAGYSSRDAREVIRKEVAKYLIAPWVDVVVISYKVTFIGEVVTQGPITIPNERLSIIEGIAQAGGLPPTARYDRVWLIREENGERSYHLLNINSPKIFQSEYYYLRNNDIVYAEPNKTKQFLGANAPYVTAFTLAASVMALTLALLK